MTSRDHCDNCGSSSFTSATFRAGRLTCKPCIDLIATSQRQAARKRFDSAPGVLVPPTQLSFSRRELANCGGVLRG